MAVNKVVYGNRTLIDLTEVTVTADTLLEGYTALDKRGELITGRAVAGSGEAISIIDEPDSHGGTIRHITSVSLAGDTVSPATLLAGYTAHNSLGQRIVGTASGGGGTITLQEKTATPTKSEQILMADPGYTALSQVTINPIPAEYIIPEFQDKTVTPTESEQVIEPDTDYDGLSSVTVGAISSTYIGSGVARRSSSDLTASGATVSVPAGYYADSASKSVASGSAATPATTIAANPSISVSASGLITASASGYEDITPNVTAGYVASGSAGRVTVSGSNTQQLSTQAGATITPSETEQTAVAAGKYTTGAIKIGAISSTYVGSGITRRSSTDLTASGATVTVPAGYYSAQASKAITTGTATAPTSISGTTATVSTGTNTLTLTKTVSVTPRITTAGYISSGTAGNATVTLTANVTTKAAATITPGTSSQTIASGTYLTGTQTIAGDANLVGGNILSGKSIFGVAGTVSFRAIYTGTSAPPSTLGEDGDVYIQTA